MLHRRYSAALWTSVVFMGVGLFDGFLKVELVRRPLIGYWIFDLAKWLVLPLLLLYAVQRSRRIRPADYGLSMALGSRDIAAMLPLTVFSLFVIGRATEIFWGNWLYAPPPFSNLEMLAILGPLHAAGAIFFSVTAGLWESIFSIGLPWLWWSQGYRASAMQGLVFTVVSSVVFALGHWENGLPNLLAAFAFQIGAIAWYLRLGTLWPVILAHTLIDLYYFWP